MILQARTLEWVAISFSNAWKWRVKLKSFSRVWLLATPWTAADQAPPSMGFSRREYGSGVPLPSPLFKIVTCKLIIWKAGSKKILNKTFIECTPWQYSVWDANMNLMQSHPEKRGAYCLGSSPWWLTWKRICLQCRRPGFGLWVGKNYLEKGMATHSSILVWDNSMDRGAW